MKKDAVAAYLKMEVIVGAFVLLVFVVLVYFTIILSRENWFGRKDRLSVRFSNVLGLRDGDNVVVRGMEVGKVKKLTLTDSGVVVTLSLDQPIEIHEDYTMNIVPSSVLGGRYLEIDEGSHDRKKIASNQVLEGVEPTDLMADASKVMAELRKGMVDGGIVENIRTTTENINRIVKRIEAGEGTLGKLLSSDDKLYTDISATASSLKTITARLESGQGTLGKLMSPDDTLYKDAAATVSSLKTVSARLESGQGTLGRLLSTDDKLYRDLSETVASLNVTAKRLENGEGVLGRLLKDDSLYNDIQATVGEARATIDDYREQAPVITFTSIFFGAF